jgi:phage tail-like protein
MTRAAVAGLTPSVTVCELLPSVYQDDQLTSRFTGAFDDVLAPVFHTLDSIDAYVDPLLTPDDFLGWLAGWVGIIVAEDWPLDRQRRFIAGAVAVFRQRGTVAGLRAELEVYTGGAVEVVDSGACEWALAPNAPLGGSSPPTVTIRVRVDDPDRLSQEGLEAVVGAAKPAHVLHRIEVLATGENGPG